MEDEQTCWKIELDKVTKFDPSKKKKKKKKKKRKPFEATYDSLFQKGHFSEDDAPHFRSGRRLLLERDYGYSELLSRVFYMLREDNLEVSSDRPRTVMMRPQLLAQGTHITVCLDFAHLCRTMHRKPGHVINFLLGQLETKGSFNKLQQLEMMALVSSQYFHTVFQRYIDAFVLCSCCKSPDTSLVEDNNISTLSCGMCGLVASINEIWNS